MVRQQPCVMHTALQHEIREDLIPIGSSHNGNYEMSPKGMYLLPPSLIEYNSSTIMTGAAPNKCQYISARLHSIISKNTDLPPFVVTYLLLYQLT
jgi:hypothetical protein